MSEEKLLFEIKPKYNILYTILTHFWDILVFVTILTIIRITIWSYTKCNYSICYMFNRFLHWIVYKKEN